jgi:hypothetical protein
MQRDISPLGRIAETPCTPPQSGHSTNPAVTSGEQKASVVVGDVGVRIILLLRLNLFSGFKWLV